MSMAAIEKLKKRIQALERKEAQMRKTLQCAMKEARKFAKTTKSKLIQAEKKGRKLASAMVKMEKGNVSRLVKKVARKADKSAILSKVKQKLKKL